jgi:glucokinase-like ROK family protein
MQPLATDNKVTREQTKQHNKRLILNTIYNHTEISRVDISRFISLTRTTVSANVAELIEEGLVEEIGHAPSVGGKPATLLSLAADSRHLIALDLGNSKLHGAVINLRGQICHRVSAPINGHSGEAALNLVYHLIDQLMTQTDRPLLGIGLGTPGVIDTTQGIIRRAVNLDWQDLPLRDLLTERYNLPIHVGNDSHVAALAEYTFGQYKHTNNLIVVKVGRGIGTGLVVNGQLFCGDAFGAGEIGHVVVVENGELCRCGNYGCLETVASSQAILKEARLLAQNDPHSRLLVLAKGISDITVDHLWEAFQAGDTTLNPVLAKAGRYLGVAIAHLVGALNIEHVLIAGTIARFNEALLGPLKEELNKRAFAALVKETHVEVSSLGADIVLLGAAALLLSNELGLG